MQPVRLKFIDFWDGFENENWFLPFLSSHFPIEIAEKPDFIIYSDFGDEHLRYGCTRIYYTGENSRPDFHRCDYAFTFDYSDHPRHYRLPLYRLYFNETDLTQNRNVENILHQNRRFCCMVVSNPNARERVDFFHALSAYRHVDSGGKVLNNVGGPVPDKRPFIRNYKFAFAFENSSYSGYTTEKLVEAWVEGCVPIYWGNPRVDEEFNPNAFINLNAFKTWSDAIEYIGKVDTDCGLYEAYLRAPLFPENRLPAGLTERAIVEKFAAIFQGGKRNLCLRRALEGMAYLARKTVRHFHKKRARKC